jgi:Domain of unknown function (DUF5666)
MPRAIVAVGLLVVAILVAGCGSAGPNLLPQPATATVATAARGQRLSGLIQTISNGMITLDDGTSFTVSSDTRLTRVVQATLADLRVGDYVAVTAKRQSDNTLLATIVNVFPDTLRGVGVGQRPLNTGDLITNATIDSVDATGFTVKFPEGTAQVKLTPDAQITRQVTATLTDLKEGSQVLAVVANGVAQSVTFR